MDKRGLLSFNWEKKSYLISLLMMMVFVLDRYFTLTGFQTYLKRWWINALNDLVPDKWWVMIKVNKR